MPTYKAPVRDMHFLLKDVWPIEDSLAALPHFGSITPDLVDAVLQEAAKLCENLLFPLNSTGDNEGCRFDQGNVYTPKNFTQAYQTFVAAGWPGLASDPAFGGQGFPHMIGVFFEEMCCASNLSFSLYTGLTHGVSLAIQSHAASDLQQTYLPKMTTGEWTGVMCLTESHCGSDLRLLRTKAEPNDDHSYNITGTKIFITAGEHDMAENIIHLVLARVPGGPKGIKGISLFLVPKFLVNDDGSLGARNGIVCGSIEHKMGIKASSTCVMNYNGAKGFLVGELHRGMAAMFTVMNTERLAIGLQGLGLSDVAYQNALHYAKDRLQGRAPSGAAYPEKPADPILVHPDIRRMLLTIKAHNEAARALAFYVAQQVDFSRHHPNAERREHAEGQVALLTPVVKAFFSDFGFETCNLALQVFGGHGYVSEWGIEQYVRDARIAQIYEGTNGIQALDLVRRKLVANQGAFLKVFCADVEDFSAQNTAADMKPFIEPLQQAMDRLQQVSQFILESVHDDPAAIGAAATDYLRLFGLTTFAYMWARMASTSLRSDRETPAFYQAKRHTAEFYMQRILPQTEALATIIRSGSTPLMSLEDTNF